MQAARDYVDDGDDDADTAFARYCHNHEAAAAAPAPRAMTRFVTGARLSDPLGQRNSSYIAAAQQPLKLFIIR